MNRRNIQNQSTTGLKGVDKIKDHENKGEARNESVFLSDIIMNAYKNFSKKYKSALKKLAD